MQKKVVTHLLSGVLTGFFGNVIDGHNITGAQDGFAINGNSLGPHNFVQTVAAILTCTLLRCLRNIKPLANI